MLHVDSFFTQGKSHKVCEDYALSVNSDVHLFSVSDGCSSSKHSDFGSRILSKSLEAGIKLPVYQPDQGESLIPLSVYLWNRSLDVTHFLSMDKRCLDATLVFGFVKDGKAFITMFGDGCFAIEYKDKMIKYFDVEYDQNAPYYLAYHFDEDRKKSFNELKQVKKVSTTIYFPNGGESVGSHESYNEVERFTFELDNIRSISLFTDGVKTLLPNNPSNPKKKMEEIIKELIRFPIPSGEFVNRKCMRFIKNNPDYHFFDDFSMATLINGD